MSTLSVPHQWIDRVVKVALIGCGGTGSEFADELFRIHTLLIKLGGKGLDVVAFDEDTVSAANIGRQRFWPVDQGFQKAEVLITRINSFGGVDWISENRNFDVEDVDGFDLLITCVDDPGIRAAIGQQAKQHDDNHFEHPILWLDCGNDDNSGNVILGHYCAANQDHIPNVFDLYPCLAQMDNSDQPSCSTAEALSRQDYGINRTVAREGANLIWQLLRHGEVDHHGSYIDIKRGTTHPLAIDPAQWASFGYTSLAIVA